MTANPLPTRKSSAANPLAGDLAAVSPSRGVAGMAKAFGFHQILRRLADLRITVVGLGLLMALVFFGTLAQVEQGIWLVQARYFESWFVWKTVGGVNLPLMPGGYLLGAVLVVNLLAAHALRWKVTSIGRKRIAGYIWTLLGVGVVFFTLFSPRIEQALEGGGPMRIILVCSALILPLLVGSALLFGKRAGIVLIHVGLLVILGGEVATDVGSVESAMIIDEGAAVSYTEDQFATELAVVETSAVARDTVFSISTQRLAQAAESSEPIEHEAWPMRFRVDRFFPNARFTPAGHSPMATPAQADHGLGVGIPVREVAQATAVDERDVPAAYLTLETREGQTLGTWLVSSAFREAQPVAVGTRTFSLQLRPKRYPKPFTVALLDFQHRKHNGTAIPSDFASVVRLTDPRNGVDREARIFMNHPLRYDGLTFYQASFANNDTTSILQVVKNPAWLLPYLACGLMSVGMLAQFGGHLNRFGNRREQEQKKQARREAKPQDAAVGPKLSPVARWAPWVVAVLLVAYVGSKARPVGQDTAFDLQAFAALPVSHEGRVKPLDTVARSTLLTMYGKQSGKVAMPAADENQSAETIELSAIRWLLEVASRPDIADRYRLFTIHDPDVLDLLDLSPTDKHFAYAELFPNLGKVSQQAAAARELEAPQRNRYQRAVLNLERNVADYQSLKYMFAPERAFTFHREITAYADVVAMMRRGELDPAEVQAELGPVLTRYGELAQRTRMLTVPPRVGASEEDPTHDWHTHGVSLQTTYDTAKLDPAVSFFAQVRDAYRAGDAPRFNQLVEIYQSHTAVKAEPKAPFEAAFNLAQPFAKSMALYVLAMILACLSWIKWPQVLGRTAFAVVILAMILHTAGLLARMWIEGRPPVTNLYSSAVFVGWGAVVLGIVMEKLWKNGIGTATAAGIGFGTLIIAHHLSLTGDTMEAMRAVLDSNFWLGTHVVTITLGYSATFLAGFLAIVYVVRRATRSLNRPTADALGRMVYGILCFAILLSFVGTVLGGIWGDQSWGRFWGWDPKENGALMIVMWNAIILHARWGGIIKTRGVMMMAIFGNLVTAFSWFGVNMLGVGLHSYGFMDAAFMWLILFALSQIAFIILGFTFGNKMVAGRVAAA